MQKTKYNIMLKPTDIENINPWIPDFEVLAAFNPGVHKSDGGYVLFLRVPEAPKIRREKIIESNPKYCSPRFVFDGNYDSATISINEGRPEVKVDEFTFEDCSIHDPRGIELNDGSSRLLSISIIRCAWSPDGRKIESIEDDPVIPASSITPYEEYGIEDPRIIPLDGEYILSTVGPSSHGIVTIFRKTKDLENFSEPWLVTLPGCKDTFPFPEKINEKYWRVERPSRDSMTKKESIYLSSSKDLCEWGNSRILISCRDGSFDSDGIGSSAPPIRIDDKWLLIYHGRKHGLHYSNGALLMDENLKVIARSKRPIVELRRNMGKSEIPGITFVSAAVLEDGGNNNENKIIRVFGGAADRCPFSAEIPLTNVFNSPEYL